MRALVWFRRDLRIEDNTALYEAAKRAGDGVVGAYILSPGDWGRHDEAAVKVDFWLRSLSELSNRLARLNIPVLIGTAPRPADVPRVVLELAHRAVCPSLFFNREYEVDESSRDEESRRLFESRGMTVHAFDDRVVLAPGEVRTGEGAYFTVFTPFKRAWLRVLDGRGFDVLPPPKKQRPINVTPPEAPAGVEGYRSTVDPALWPTGEAHALRLLERFAERSIDEYDSARERADLDGTSRLSPYLAAGVLSPRQCLAMARDANSGRLDEHKRGSRGAAIWISELIWRDFYQHVLVGFPRVSMGRAFKPQTDRIRWATNDEHLAAWQAGRTGVPIVDAAMRCIAATGWMHNRLRMIVAMYLSKDLFLDWRLGERHFMRRLVDGDLGANNGGWQWSASTGADAAPYFRVFNPVAQSRRCDPDGAFIRRWVPELSRIDDDAVHDPAVLPPLARARLDYPDPIVDHTAARDRAIKAFKGLR